ncbi:LuxR C-terminal-related transcriptional regulator [Streptomyces sp. CB02009]|uniref:LuxR C-terminal-related transcriptional regulator n=1 Tax=Streptomyces sp. CB02009 TaxID=1703938 RepID=UPI00116150FC|nr:LuxR family transcriptional regulator [Streptomyces sp. CB02009]
MDIFPVFERAADLGHMKDFLADLPESGGRAVIVEGEAGIGKTRLIEKTQELAMELGVVVLSASGSDLERKFPFGIVRQLFELPLLRASDEDGLLIGAASAASHVFTGENGPTGNSEAATLHGLFWLTANFCSGPTLMVIDDLHCCDVASLRYLAYLLPRLKELPLLVVAGFRTGEQPEDGPLFSRILTDPGVVEISPAPLSEQASHDLLRSAIGSDVDPEFATACRAATAGNPLLLHALARTVLLQDMTPEAANSSRVASLGPRALSHWVAPRLARVEDTTRRVAEAASVLGPGAQLDALAELAETDVLAATEATSDLARLGLLKIETAGEFTSRSVTFSHALVQSAVYGTLTDRQRATAHARAARVLSRLGADGDRVAAHVLQTPAGDDGPEIVALMRSAAAAALLRGSPETGYAYLRRALKEKMHDEERLSLLRETAAVAVQVDLMEAAPLLEEALTYTTDPAELADINARLGAAYGFLRAPDRACDALQEALRHLPPEQEDERRRLEATLLVAVFVAPGRVSLRDRLPELRSLPAYDSMGGRMLDCMIASQAMAVGDTSELHRVREALVDGRLVREANGEGPLVCGWIALLASDDPLGMTSLEQAVKHAQRQGSPRAIAPAYSFRSLALLWAGQLSEAETDARTALGLAETGRVDMDPCFAGAYLAQTLVEQGRLAEAEAVLEELSVLPPHDSPGPVYYLFDAHARLLREQGRFQAAARTARDASKVWQFYGFDNPSLAGWRTELTLALHALGRSERAGALAREEVEATRKWGAPRAYGRALRVLGVVTGGQEGIASLRESAAVLARGTARLESARTAFALGTALVPDRRDEAQQHLLQALDHADVCGAAPLMAECTTALRAAGFRPRRTRATGPDSLTPSERRVALLAITGATNREVAQELFVTPKTVEVHLSSIYRKLRISSREQLADFAGRLADGT